MPSSKGVAIKNCPSLLDFKALTGNPFLSLISKITLGRILPFSSKVMPAIKFGLSGDWGNTKSLAKVAAIAGVVLTGIGSGLSMTFGLAAAAGLTTVFARGLTVVVVGFMAAGLAGVAGAIGIAAAVDSAGAWYKAAWGSRHIWGCNSFLTLTPRIVLAGFNG